ncbi:MAG: hypothetical protein ACQES4_07405 [Bacillota bacterium]
MNTGRSILTRLVFLGTKANVEKGSEEHKYNASLLIFGIKKKILIDYGTGHAKSLNRINPDAVLITHAHPNVTLAYDGMEVKVDA